MVGLDLCNELHTDAPQCKYLVLHHHCCRHSLNDSQIIGICIESIQSDANSIDSLGLVLDGGIYRLNIPNLNRITHNRVSIS